jgi:hypothetical protein
MTARPGPAHPYFSVFVAALIVGAFAASLAQDAPKLQPKSIEMKFTPCTAVAFPFDTPNPGFNSLGDTLDLPARSKDGYKVAKGEYAADIDTDCDGKMDARVKGKDDVVSLKLMYEDAVIRPYAMRITTPLYTGINGEESKEFRYQRSCWMQGRFENVRFILIDDDSNGIYNSMGSDAMVVGNSQFACPLGKRVSIGGRIYDMVPVSHGTKVSFTPAVVDCGKIDVTTRFKSPGGKPVWCVLQCGDDYYDVVSSGEKEFVLPIGEYSFVQGCVAAGTDRAKIRPGTLRKIRIEKDKTYQLEWGGPLKMEFSYVVDGYAVKVGQADIRISGPAGEIYYDFENKPKIFMGIEVDVRSAQTKQLAKTGTVTFLGPNDTTQSEIEVRNDKGPFEVKIKQNGYTRLMGAFESDWQGQ